MPQYFVENCEIGGKLKIFDRIYFFYFFEDRAKFSSIAGNIKNCFTLGPLYNSFSFLFMCRKFLLIIGFVWITLKEVEGAFQLKAKSFFWLCAFFCEFCVFGASRGSIFDFMNFLKALMKSAESWEHFVT